MEGIGIMVLSNKQIMIIINDLKNEYRGICYKNIRDRQKLCDVIDTRYNHTLFVLFSSRLVARHQYIYMMGAMQKMYKQNTSF